MTVPRSATVERSGWVVFYATEDDPFAHIVPNFGREHDLTALACWCHPEPLRFDPTVIVHNVEH